MGAGWLLAALLAFGPNGPFVAAALVDEPAVAVVPRAFVHDTLAPLYVVTFDGAVEPLEQQGALYLPADESRRVAALGALGGEVVRLLPGIRAPRLALRRSLFFPCRTEGAPCIVPVGEMPVDVAERFFDALLEARFEQLLGDPEVRRVLEQRADELFTEAAPEERLALHRGALVAFGANLLSIAVQVERIHARRGRALCPLIERRALLFAHWGRTIESVPFHGLLAAPGTDDRAEGWTRAALAKSDKLWLIETVVGASWTGEPSHDFATLCA